MKSPQQGFSLLEAIVAIVILSTTGIALYSWMNSSLIAVNRVREVMEQQQVVRETLPFVETINPMLTERGTKDLGQYQLSWHSSLIEPPKEGVDFPDGVSIFRLGLYNVDVRVERGADVYQYSTRQAGFKQVRELPES